jgi:hypothetical protein
VARQLFVKHLAVGVGQPHAVAVVRYSAAGFTFTAVP